MPLVVAPIGRELRVIKILTDEKTKKHLENLGITICSIKDGRLALDKSVATKIFVA